MNIVLIGMRGSGKSSVGRLLSQELGMHFVDLDEVLQRERGKKIKDIVTEEGWNAFRKYESEVVDDVKDCENTVISTGGGVILNADNTKKLKKNGYIIWLSGEVDTLLKRIGKGANRPSLTGKPLREDLQETLGARETLYKEACNLKVVTDNKNLIEIIKEINEALGKGTV